jgi:myo-inositol-1(or 4)-monophosphatase
LPSPDSSSRDFGDLADRDLIVDAARACGPLLRERFGTPVKMTNKPGGSPVTEIDLALDDQLKRTLRSARSDYGWLSEETADTPDRLAHERIFIVDPLDGTSAFINGKPEFAVAIAVAARGALVASVVYNPITDELFEAARGAGARRNGAPLTASAQKTLDGATILSTKTFFQSARWSSPWPAVKPMQKAALTLRLAHVAASDFDGAISLGPKNEWDIAPGAILITEAGGAITGSQGQSLLFNQPDPRNPGVVAGGAALHPLLIEQLRIRTRPPTPTESPKA